jgi:hypothetical protein
MRRPPSGTAVLLEGHESDELLLDAQGLRDEGANSFFGDPAAKRFRSIAGGVFGSECALFPKGLAKGPCHLVGLNARPGDRPLTAMVPQKTAERSLCSTLGPDRHPVHAKDARRFLCDLFDVVHSVPVSSFGRRRRSHRPFGFRGDGRYA